MPFYACYCASHPFDTYGPNRSYDISRKTATKQRKKERKKKKSTQCQTKDSCTKFDSHFLSTQ